LRGRKGKKVAKVRYVLVFLVVFLLAGCGSVPTITNNSAEELLFVLEDAEAEELEELAAGSGEDYYVLRSVREEEGFVEIELYLKFNPLTFEEVMRITDPLAEEAASLFDYKVPVAVSAIYTVVEEEESVFGESIFNPETGRTQYKHFGRDHLLRYGDP